MSCTALFWRGDKVFKALTFDWWVIICIECFWHLGPKYLWERRWRSQECPREPGHVLEDWGNLWTLLCSRAADRPLQRGYPWNSWVPWAVLWTNYLETSPKALPKIGGDLTLGCGGANSKHKHVRQCHWSQAQRCREAADAGKAGPPLSRQPPLRTCLPWHTAPCPPGFSREALHLFPSGEGCLSDFRLTQSTMLSPDTWESDFLSLCPPCYSPVLLNQIKTHAQLTSLSSIPL